MSQITKKALANSLKKLMNQTTLENITIKDIVEDCGVNRQTFYYHFQDVYALLEWICATETLPAIEEKSNYESWQEGFVLVFESILENKKFCINAIKSLGRESFERYLYKNTSLLLSRVVDELTTNLAVSENKKSFIVDFYSFAFIGLLTQWMDNGMRENPQDIVDNIATLITGDIKKAIEKCAK